MKHIRWRTQYISFYVNIIVAYVVFQYRNKKILNNCWLVRNLHTIFNNNFFFFFVFIVFQIASWHNLCMNGVNNECKWLWQWFSRNCFTLLLFYKQLWNFFSVWLADMLLPCGLNALQLIFENFTQLEKIAKIFLNIFFIDF